VKGIPELLLPWLASCLHPIRYASRYTAPWNRFNLLFMLRRRGSRLTYCAIKIVLRICDYTALQRLQLMSLCDEDFE